MVVIPLVESKNIKDLIISTLAANSPLTTKQLHAQLKKKHAISVTYQAIHKAVNSLVLQGVLINKNRTYTINPNWVSNLSSLIEQLKRNSAKYSGIVESKQEGQTQTLTFSSFEKAQEFKKELQKEFFEQKHATQPIYAGEDRHLTSPLIYSEKSLRLLNLVAQAKAKCYIIVRGGTIIDEWCANYYRNENIGVKTGINCAERCDVVVLGNKIVQIYLPQEILQKLDEMYNSAKKISDISVPELYKEVYKKKVKVKVVITNNPELAEHVRERVVGGF